MSNIVPLSVWYPAMAQKWTPIPVPREDREAWVIHHTAGGANSDPLTYARQVADFHWGKWKRPGGYSFLVGTDGVVREMCGFDARGVHAGTTYWNHHGLALCFQGSFMKSPPTDTMLTAGAEVLSMVPLPQTTHRKVRPSYTDCPGDALIALLPLEGGEDMPLTQEDKDWIVAAIGGDNIDQTNSVWQRYAIRNSAGAFVPLIDAIQFVYRKLENTGSVDAKAVVDEFAIRLGD